VVGLEVLNNEVVRLTAIKSSAEILEPLIALARVDGIHNRNLLIENEI
jgi:hypothetical protein